ncbi:hypothetical protein [Nocardia xishanensis]|uniref:hypothetical protein n=1 Tax=Nocardia xishanensis TaxID=238964 RepID=UPI00157C0145|nr:hypothetical protein [Nocardia xishanensis]
MFAVIAHGVEFSADVDGLLGQFHVRAQQRVRGGRHGGAVAQTHDPQLGGKLVEVFVEASPHPFNLRLSQRAPHAPDAGCCVRSYSGQ